MPSTKPPDVFDRHAEWRALERIAQRPQPDLVFVLGRRRVGKSHLLSRFAQHTGGLYYQATRRTEGEQLVHLSRLVGERFDDPALRAGVTFASWEQLLDDLGRRVGDTPFVLVLDEFPYLSAASPALPSILQRYWDHDFVGRPIKLVLSGSFVTAMRALEEADQPLYGRRTARLLFGPFDVADAAAFLPGYSPLDRLIAYATFGNLPGHLARLDPQRSVAENAAAALFDPIGPLVDEAQHMLDAFLTDARVHYSILEAIATGDHTWSGITRRVGQSGGALLRPLRWLEDMGLVERVVPITEKNPARSKRALYRIADPYVTFWHRSVAPLLRAGSLGLQRPEVLWQRIVQPTLSEHLGPVFEETCRQFVRRGARLPLQPMRVGEWWDAHGNDQLDIVALDAEGRLLAAECKWGAVTREDLTALRTRATRVAAQLGAHTIHLAFFSARDEADATIREAVDAGEALWFTAADVTGD